MALPQENPGDITIRRVPRTNIKPSYVSSGTAHLAFLKGRSFVWIGLVSFVLMIFFLFSNYANTISFVVSGALFLMSAYVLWFGKKEIKEKEVAIVLRWGAYLEILRPGLNFIIPGVDAIVYEEEKEKTMYTEKAIKLPLFIDDKGKPLKIEFKLSTEDGVDFGVYYKIIDPGKAVFYAEKLKKYIADKVENCAKAAFGDTLIEDAIVNKLDVVKSVHAHLERSVWLRGSANDLLAEAGVEIESVYFNDIDLSAETKAARKKIFDEQQKAKVKEQEAKVVEKETLIETASIAREEQKALKEGKIGDAIRNRIEGIRGKEKDLTAKQVIDYEIQMEKYKKGIQITEINVGGGSELDKTVAKAAAIFSSMNGQDKKPKGEPKEESEEEGEVQKDKKEGKDQQEKKSQKDKKDQGSGKKNKNKQNKERNKEQKGEQKKQEPEKKEQGSKEEASGSED